LVLATAAHRTVAEPLARHLGCFDVVLASDDHENLKSRRKSVAITRLACTAGWSGYCYAGDCEADLAVWEHADEVIVVNPTPRLLSRIRRLGKPFSVLGTPATGWSAIVKALRPHQWAKNLLLFAPAVLAHRVDYGTISVLGIAFIAFSACASGVYVLNDIGDVAADRQHPRKRLRSFASGRLTITAGLQAAGLLFAVGLGISACLLPLRFLGLMLVYIAANVVYSGFLKRVAIVDVLVLACMYALRIEAGAVAAGVPLSDWFLTFSLFFFTSLAFAKRYTELSRLKAAGGESAAGRGSEVGDVRLLEMLGAASGYVSVLVLALYMNSDQMRALYGQSRMLWLICPLVLYWVTRLWLLASRGQLDEDPVVFALRDRISLIVGGACAIVVLLTSLLGPSAP
jgi:4-hydroxybenzoate polyprenyltransferase